MERKTGLRESGTRSGVRLTDFPKTANSLLHVRSDARPSEHVIYDDHQGEKIRLAGHPLKLDAWSLKIIGDPGLAGEFNAADLIGEDPRVLPAAALVLTWARQEDRTPEEFAAAWQFLDQLGRDN